MSEPDWRTMGDPLNDRLPPRRFVQGIDEVLPTVCNCTQEGLPYCGRPECDVDWCWYCGGEYTDPCPRHEEVGRP